LTNKSKSPRKRRLQLNAEEFAPPSNLYDTSEEPQIDDAWVKYYGGESTGGIKRLSALDEETLVETSVAAEMSQISHTPLVEDSMDGVESLPQPEEASTRQQTSQTTQFNRFPREKRLGESVSPVRDFQRKSDVQPLNRFASTPAGGKEADQEPRGSRNRFPESSGDAASLPSVSGFTASFETWLKRWSPWLKRGGSVKVCKAFYDLTHALGSDQCFTSNTAIMEITQLSRAQCIRNIHSLIDMGFLEELGESNNREAKGTLYRFNLVPRSLVQ
jgi:hypothetical protein